MIKFKRTSKVLCILCVLLVMFSEISFAIDFSKSQRSIYTGLSNGRGVRVEYHGGEPHIHELDKNGNSIGSEKINSNEKHHSNEPGISKKTREIVKEGKTKNAKDRAAHKKAKEFGDAYKSVKNRSSKASKSLISKNKSTISKARKNGNTFVFIGGLIYVVWLLLKLASGFGIFIPV